MLLPVLRFEEGLDEGLAAVGWLGPTPCARDLWRQPDNEQPDAALRETAVRRVEQMPEDRVIDLGYVFLVHLPALGVPLSVRVQCRAAIPVIFDDRSQFEARRAQSQSKTAGSAEQLKAA